MGTFTHLRTGEKPPLPGGISLLFTVYGSIIDNSLTFTII